MKITKEEFKEIKTHLKEKYDIEIIAKMMGRSVVTIKRVSGSRSYRHYQYMSYLSHRNTHKPVKKSILWPRRSFRV